MVLQIGTECVRTVTMKANPSPVFNATFNMDVYDPLRDVLKVIVMDEDVDEDDEMGAVDVCLQNLRMGHARERTFPLVRHSGEAKAKFSGNIKLVIETATFGSNVVAGDGPREEAVVKRLFDLFRFVFSRRVCVLLGLVRHLALFFCYVCVFVSICFFVYH